MKINEKRQTADQAIFDLIKDEIDWAINDDGIIRIIYTYPISELSIDLNVHMMKVSGDFILNKLIQRSHQFSRKGNRNLIKIDEVLHSIERLTNSPLCLLDRTQKLRMAADIAEITNLKRGNLRTTASRKTDSSTRYKDRYSNCADVDIPAILAAHMQCRFGKIDPINADTDLKNWISHQDVVLWSSDFDSLLSVVDINDRFSIRVLNKLLVWAFTGWKPTPAQVTSIVNPTRDKNMLYGLADLGKIIAYVRESKWAFGKLRNFYRGFYSENPLTPMLPENILFREK